MLLKNKRLQMIYEMIPGCTTFADIGTDHAFLPIYTIETGKCMKAIASDVKDGPLKVALKNIRKHGLESKISIRKGSGIETIEKGECGVVVIAGMGGFLITEILGNDLEKARSIPYFVLQPNTEEEKVRKFLKEQGFRITDENAVRDGRHVYLSILCMYDPENIEDYSEIEYCTGKILYRKQTQGSHEYYSNIKEKSEKIVSYVSNSQSEGSKQKLEEQKEILRWIEDNVKGI